MGQYRVRKAIRFCYGHRVAGHAGPCRHLHGHSARVEVECTGEPDRLGMVVDFGEIGRVVEKWILAHWDHRMILQDGDPWVAVLEERGEPLFVMDTPPTAEHLAARLFQVARDAGLPVSAVHFWETGTSVAVYREP